MKFHLGHLLKPDRLQCWGNLRTLNTLLLLAQWAAWLDWQQKDVTAIASVEWSGILAIDLSNPRGQNYQGITFIWSYDSKKSLKAILSSPSPQSPPENLTLLWPLVLLTCFPPGLGHRSSCRASRMFVVAQQSFPCSLGFSFDKTQCFFRQFFQWQFPVPC